MKENIISLDGGPPPSTEPNPKIISILESTLERARSGNIQNLIIIADPGGHAAWKVNGDTLGYQHIGALYIALHSLTTSFVPQDEDTSWDAS